MKEWIKRQFDEEGMRDFLLVVNIILSSMVLTKLVGWW